MTMIEDARDLRFLFDSARDLMESLELSHVLDAAAERIQRAIPCDLVYLLLWNEGRQALEHTHSLHFGRPVACEGCAFPLGTGITGMAAGLRRPLRVAEVVFHPGYVRCTHTRVEIRSELAVPIVVGEKLVGVLDLESTRPAAFTERAEHLGEEFSACLGLAVSRAAEYDRVRNLAVTDDLTRLRNGRFLRLLLEQQEGGSRAQDGRYSVVFIDVDESKRVNDQYGHRAGDEVLVQVAHLLQRLARRADEVCRFGGDEFVIVMPGAGEREARSLAERVRRTVEHRIFRTAEGHSLRLTVSVGVACQKADGRCAKGLLWRADRAMYRSKADGRNRVTVSDAS